LEAGYRRRGVAELLGDDEEMWLLSIYEHVLYASRQIPAVLDALSSTLNFNSRSMRHERGMKRLEA